MTITRSRSSKSSVSGDATTLPDPHHEFQTSNSVRFGGDIDPFARSSALPEFHERPRDLLFETQPALYQGLDYLEFASLLVQLEGIFKRLEAIERGNAQIQNMAEVWLSAQASAKSQRPAPDTVQRRFWTDVAALVGVLSLLVLPALTAFSIAIFMVLRESPSQVSIAEAIDVVFDRISQLFASFL